MTDKRYDIISENYKRIIFEIEETCVKNGRDPKEITLLAATKTVEPKYINHAISLGLSAIGENRVQELCEKYESLNLENCDLQFIGSLQANKIRHLVGKVSTVQSIDSLSQVKELSKRLNSNKSKMNVLVEVNVGGELSKAGVNPNDLWQFIEEINEFKEINVQGLMAIPPICEDKTSICAYFLQMHKYFIDIKAKKHDNISMHILSMGMSDDFKEAIACGSTMIRVGSALFGDRNYT